MVTTREANGQFLNDERGERFAEALEMWRFKVEIKSRAAIVNLGKNDISALRIRNDNVELPAADFIAHRADGIVPRSIEKFCKTLGFDPKFCNYDESCVRFRRDCHD